MSTPPEKSGRLTFPSEGFSLSWDVQGLEIRVTDYHNKPLRLPWKVVSDLARQAGISTTEEALKVLELTAAASATDIKQAHRDLVKVWRPDRFVSSARLRAKAQVKLEQIKQAYQVLKSHPPSPGASKQAPQEKDRSTAPPLRKVSVGDVTQAISPAFSGFRVPEGALALLAQDGGSFHFPITLETVRIGRYDPMSGALPEIDLTRIDASRSVSRRHARIVFEGGSFLLSEETGVLNGTYVNGRRLTPGESAPLRSGDKLGFGTITVVFRTSRKS